MIHATQANLGMLDGASSASLLVSTVFAIISTIAVQPTRNLRVLALAAYPTQAAATRLRLSRLVEPLRLRGVEVEVRPFLDEQTFASLYDRSQWARTAMGTARAILSRLRLIASRPTYDVLFVQREAAFLGPPLSEWALGALRDVPMVVDLDDSTWVRYTSPTYGRAANLLKPPGKPLWLIRNAAMVTCGSRQVLAFVEGMGVPCRYLPTSIDLAALRPSPEREPGLLPVLGWIGSHSTWKYLQSIRDALVEVASKTGFILRTVGGAPEGMQIPGVQTECRAWSEEEEADFFRSIDVGLYPMLDDGYSSGKSGLKSIQYMAAGVPFVISPIGEAASIGEPGRTHLAAASHDQWVTHLSRLLTDPLTRKAMGQAGRAYAEAHFSTDMVADTLAEVLHEVAQRPVSRRQSTLQRSMRHIRELRPAGHPLEARPPGRRSP